MLIRLIQQNSTGSVCTCLGGRFPRHHASFKPTSLLKKPASSIWKRVVGLLALSAQLQVYLDEFVFRHNRRVQPAAAFQTLLGLGTARQSTEYERIRGAVNLGEDPDL
jgi:hypothetical protein